MYAMENNLLSTPGWIRFCRLAKRQTQMFCEVNQVKLKTFSAATKFKYGYKVPKNYNQALNIDKLNTNTKWQDATQLELKVMDDYEVFTDNGFTIPEGYKCIPVNIIFYVKHDGRYKARLVAGGHLTDTPIESVYSGVVSLQGLRFFFLIAELNKLEVWATDITSAYLEAFTNESRT